MDHVNAHLWRNKFIGRKHVTPRIVCVDGFSLSVQASETHYSAPRENVGPYVAVEVGFPAPRGGSRGGMARPKCLAPYSDGPQGGIYGYVPVEIVNDLIRRHGGVRTPAPTNEENQDDPA